MANETHAGYTAILALGTEKYDVLDFSVSFNRDTDQKGRPSSAVRAGDLSFTIEITEMASLVEAMINAQNKPIESGSVTFWQSGDAGEFRKVEFKNAYITGYQEGFQPSGSTNFSCSVTINAEKVSIGEAQYDAGWPTHS